MLLEQALGHVTYARNLRAALAATTSAAIEWYDVPDEPRRKIERLPLRSTWTVQTGLAARKIFKRGGFDAAYVHTQVPAVLLGRLMTQVPTVVSVDATPRQFDLLGSHYAHRIGPAPVEALKWRANATCLQRAAAVVAWSRWAADSLVDDYGVDPDRVEIIQPGVVGSLWRRPRQREARLGPLRILFVGGDFVRKGGPLLLAAFDRLLQDPDLIASCGDIELHIVTGAGAEVAPQPGVVIHRELEPNSGALVDLFHSSDIFALPTQGDCLPFVLAEAAMAGLPMVATDVGAISEIVVEGETGHLVDRDVLAMTATLRRLIVDDEHRRRLSDRAATLATSSLDAEANAHRLLELVLEQTSQAVQEPLKQLSDNAKVVQ